MTRAEETGRKVLAALDAGRAVAVRRAREQGVRTMALVAELVVLDARAGRPVRGRAGRIARKLRGMLTEGQIRRKLRTLSSMHALAAHDGRHRITTRESDVRSHAE